MSEARFHSQLSISSVRHESHLRKFMKQSVLFFLWPKHLFSITMSFQLECPRYSYDDTYVTCVLIYLSVPPPTKLGDT